MKNPFKDHEKEDFTYGFADYLMRNHSISPDEAHKMAKDFYKKNKKKLGEVLK
jgi:hypothetical protein